MHKCSVTYEGLTYPSSENAYQASKCENPNEKVQFQFVEPYKAKRLGKQVKLKEGFDDQRLKIMEEILRIKFSQEPLRTQLIQTYPKTLEEGNTWGDTFWGIYNGKGQNHLGKILMKIRQSLYLKDSF